MHPAKLLTLILVFGTLVLAQDPPDESIESLQGTSLKPYRVDEQITVGGTIARYPYIQKNMEARELARRVNQFPAELKYELYLATFTHFNDETFLKCYRDNSCRAIQHYKKTIDEHSKSRNITDFYLVMICRDELHDISIKKYLRRKNVSQPEFSKQLKLYHQKLVELPAVMLSIDLASTMERNKFVVPDCYMLYDKWATVREDATKGSQKYPWDKKISKIFWRGGDSGYSYNEVDVWSDLPNYYPRIELVRLSSVYPEKIDAELTYLYEPGVRENLTKRGLDSKIAKNKVNIEDHMQYKYLISVDGWTSAWMRVPWILSSNSLLIKQNSKKVSWYDWQLKPTEHYYPVNNNLSDILEVYKKAEEYPGQVQNVIKQANKFAKDKFIFQNMIDEMLNVIKNYSSIQNVTFTDAQKVTMIFYQKPFENFASMTSEQLEKQYTEVIETKILYFKIATILIGIIIFYVLVTLILHFNFSVFLKYKWQNFLLSCVEMCRGTPIAEFIFKKKLAQQFLSKRTKNTHLVI